MWVEHLARETRDTECYPFPFINQELDFRPLLQPVAADRLKGRDPSFIARAFQRGLRTVGLRTRSAIGWQRKYRDGCSLGRRIPE